MQQSNSLSRSSSTTQSLAVAFLETRNSILETRASQALEAERLLANEYQNLLNHVTDPQTPQLNGHSNTVKALEQEAENLKKEIRNLRQEVHQLKQSFTIAATSNAQDPSTPKVQNDHEDLLDLAEFCSEHAYDSSGADTLADLDLVANEVPPDHASVSYLHLFHKESESSAKENIPGTQLQLIENELSSSVPGGHFPLLIDSTYSFCSSPETTEDKRSSHGSTNFAYYGIQYTPNASRDSDRRTVVIYNLPGETVLSELAMLYCETGILSMAPMRIGKIPGLVQTSALMLVFLSSYLARSYAERWSKYPIVIQGKRVKVELVPTATYPIPSNLHAEIMSESITRFIKIIHDPQHRTGEEIIRSLGRNRYENTLGVVDYFTGDNGVLYIEFFDHGYAKDAIHAIRTKQGYEGTVSELAYEYGQEAETFRVRRAAAKRRYHTDSRGVYVDIDASQTKEVFLDYGEGECSSGLAKGGVAASKTPKQKTAGSEYSERTRCSSSFSSSFTSPKSRDKPARSRQRLEDIDNEIEDGEIIG